MFTLISEVVGTPRICYITFKIKHTKLNTKFAFEEETIKNSIMINFIKSPTYQFTRNIVKIISVTI